ncbi:uncharacterized protein LOC108953393 [Musa acuminata AAA Group]|uniref:uncharacterized protein LOC108953393 n=1 Tax=Musa acuminata AAA Group TaxID=214697 RepID=UPI0008A0B13D|nr:PREDICTED: uncharacterized protein LOC108953393 [Musa acuminata subsp. malaccensis]
MLMSGFCVARGVARRAADDEMALVRAAAWAWYQQGSGKVVRESDDGRRVGVDAARNMPRPSRYKLEALAASKVCPAIALLDVYDVEWITRELDRVTMASRSSTGGGDRHRRSAKDAAALEGMRRARGSWARHAVDICWSKGDVVEEAALSPRRWRQTPMTPVSKEVKQRFRGKGGGGHWESDKV